MNFKTCLILLSIFSLQPQVHAGITLDLEPGGAASLRNESATDSIILTEYSITPSSGGVALSPSGWSSLGDATIATTDELSETIPTGKLFAPGETFSIGIPFDLRADANADGVVDGSDLLIMSANWDQFATGPENGDFDYSGHVSFNDNLILAGDWTNEIRFNLATTETIAVPEASNILMYTIIACLSTGRWYKGRLTSQL